MFMDIYIYSDESGVFDREHNDVFVFGGLIFLYKEDKEIWERKYINAERTIRKIECMEKEAEVKASNISQKNKGKLYRSLNQTSKFAVIINQNRVLPKVFADKKTKQRYLDFVFKIAVRRHFERLISEGVINPDEVENLYFYIDQHTTATNGRYELRQALESEFKKGTFNWAWDTFYPPLFPKLKSLELNYYDSKKKTLIRAADIIANHVFYLAKRDNMTVASDDNLTITYLPKK